MRRIQFTKGGYDDLKKEHDELQEKRKDAVAELATARGMGDLSENAAYKVARQKLSRIDSRLRYVIRILKQASVVEQNKDGFIDLGSMVVIDSGIEKKTVILVDGYESDIAKGKISIYSPIGKELRGKRKGDKIVVRILAGVKEYIITDNY